MPPVTVIINARCTCQAYATALAAVGATVRHAASDSPADLIFNTGGLSVAFLLAAPATPDAPARLARLASTFRHAYAVCHSAAPPPQEAGLAGTPDWLLLEGLSAAEAARCMLTLAQALAAAQPVPALSAPLPSRAALAIALAALPGCDARAAAALLAVAPDLGVLASAAPAELAQVGGLSAEAATALAHAFQTPAV